MLSEIIDEQRSLCFVSAETGHILDDDRFNGVLLNLFIDLVDTLTVEMHSADVIVKGFSDDLMMIGVSELHEDVSLIRE